MVLVYILFWVYWISYHFGGKLVRLRLGITLGFTWSCSLIPLYFNHGFIGGDVSDSLLLDLLDIKVSGIVCAMVIMIFYDKYHLLCYIFRLLILDYYRPIA